MARLKPFFVWLFACRTGSSYDKFTAADEPVSRDLQTRTIVDDILLADPGLATLGEMFQASGLQGALCISNCNYTVFAPINKAFTTLDQSYVAKLLTPNYIAHLKNLLAFHIATPSKDRVLANQLQDGHVFTQLNGENVTVNVEGVMITITSDNTVGSKVVGIDNIARNGVVHKVDSVLLPAFWDTDLFSLCQSYAGFDLLFELLKLVGLGGVVPGDYTIMAPTNDAILALGNEKLEFLRDPENLSILTALLANHAISGLYPSMLIEDGLTVTTFGKTTLTFNKVNDIITVNGASVLLPDVLASNGIAHAIDRVLLNGINLGQEPTTSPTKGTVQLPSVDVILLEDPDFATLSAGFRATGLYRVLCTNCNYTIFAPLNEAFTALDRSYLAKLLSPDYIAHLRDLLSFHVSTPSIDRVLADQLQDGQVITQLNNENIAINIEGTNITITSKNTVGSKVVALDNIAINGNVHKVDSVLLPAFWDIEDVAGLAKRAEAKEISIFFELLNATGLTDLTILAPTDEAFLALGSETIDAMKNPANRSNLTRLVTNHILDGIYPSLFIENGMTLHAFGGLEIVFQKVNDEIIVNGATIVKKDVLTRTSIVHAINKVLIEADRTETTTPTTGSTSPTNIPSITSPTSTLSTVSPTTRPGSSPITLPIAPSFPPLGFGPTPVDTRTSNAATVPSLLVPLWFCTLVVAIAMLACVDHSTI